MQSSLSSFCTYELIYSILQILCIPILFAYPYMTYLSQPGLSIILNIASVIKNNLSVSISASHYVFIYLIFWDQITTWITVLNFWYTYKVFSNLLRKWKRINFKKTLVPSDGWEISNIWILYIYPPPRSLRPFSIEYLDCTYYLFPVIIYSISMTFYIR